MSKITCYDCEERFDEDDITYATPDGVRTIDEGNPYCDSCLPPEPEEAPAAPVLPAVRTPTMTSTGELAPEATVLLQLAEALIDIIASTDLLKNRLVAAIDVVPAGGSCVCASEIAKHIIHDHGVQEAIHQVAEAFCYMTSDEVDERITENALCTSDEICDIVNDRFTILDRDDVRSMIDDQEFPSEDRVQEMIDGSSVNRREVEELLGESEYMTKEEVQELIDAKCVEADPELVKKVVKETLAELKLPDEKKIRGIAVEAAESVIENCSISIST